VAVLGIVAPGAVKERFLGRFPAADLKVDVMDGMAEGAPALLFGIIITPVGGLQVPTAAMLFPNELEKVGLGFPGAGFTGIPATVVAVRIEVPAGEALAAPLETPAAPAAAAAAGDLVSIGFPGVIAVPGLHAAPAEALVVVGVVGVLALPFIATTAGFSDCGVIGVTGTAAVGLAVPGTSAAAPFPDTGVAPVFS
jgi:hypothetical protein